MKIEIEQAFKETWRPHRLFAKQIIVEGLFLLNLMMQMKQPLMKN